MTTGDVVIAAEGLSKKYRIGRSEGQAPYRTLRETLINLAKAPGRRLKMASRNSLDLEVEKEIWALKDVSFEVRRGDAVGIIGRNGSGKSTLLKILSCITEPTSGLARVKGRVGSLLEVGTGFHNELTGRENIFLNGAILGMRKAEIARRFEEIVEFSEVSQFLDTPVKHYSSGMYLRLAFAVAAHLDPEILLVDEVLAVGDAAFQTKCLGKMGEVARGGRTVLFVSHNMAAIASLTRACLWLEDGRLLAQGQSHDVVVAYHTSMSPAPVAHQTLTGCERFGNGKARFTSLHLTPIRRGGDVAHAMHMGDDLQIEVRIAALQRISDATCGVTIYSMAGERIIDANIAVVGRRISLECGEEAIIKWTLNEVLLRPDTYQIALWLGRRNLEDIDHLRYAGTLSVGLDPASTTNDQVFPGVYQCRFDVGIEFVKAR